MPTFLGVFLLVYGAMHAYLMGRIWFACPHSRGLAAALVAAGFILTAAPLAVWFMERQGWHRIAALAAWPAYVWMAYVFLFVCIGLLFDVGSGLIRLSTRVSPLTPAWTLGLAAMLSLALLIYGFFEARRIRIERIDIVTPKLATGRVTIAQLSDLHLGLMQGEGLLDRVLAQLAELEPDMVVATGDIVDGQGDDFPSLARRLRGYRPPLGAYAVTGNHEYYVGLDTSLRFLREAGFRVLGGEAVRAGGIVLAGVDDPTVAGSRQGAERQEAAALAPLRPDEFVVLLKHQPRVMAGSRFDLQLSGHIHGGQIHPFVYFTRLAYTFRTGLTQLDNGRKLYVSRGAGTWGPPIRLLAPPEIALITISSAND